MTDPNSQLGFDPWTLPSPSRPSAGSKAASEGQLQEPRQYDGALLMLGALLVSVGGIALAIAFGYALLRVLGA